MLQRLPRFLACKRMSGSDGIDEPLSSAAEKGPACQADGDAGGPEQPDPFDREPEDRGAERFHIPRQGIEEKPRTIWSRDDACRIDDGSEEEEALPEQHCELGEIPQIGLSPA